MARDGAHERGDLLERQRRRGRVVRVADDHEPGGGGDLLEHRVEVVTVALVDRDLDRAGARRGREVRVDAEARPGVDELGARLEQRLAGGEQDVARAVADRDPVDGDVVAVAERLAQRAVRRVGIAVEPAQRPRDRVLHGLHRREGRLVGREHGDVARQRVAVGGGIDGDAADPLGELDRHGRAQPTARPAGPGGAPRSRPGRRAPARAGRPRRRGSSRGSRCFIAPGTPISCAHISGTRLSPMRRAATAGNSASRSGVSVNRQETRSPVSSPLRPSSSCISASVASRMASASLAATVLAPRSAMSRTAQESSGVRAGAGPAAR